MIEILLFAANVKPFFWRIFKEFERSEYAEAHARDFLREEVEKRPLLLELIHNGTVKYHIFINSTI